MKLKMQRATIVRNRPSILERAFQQSRKLSFAGGREGEVYVAAGISEVYVLNRTYAELRIKRIVALMVGEEKSRLLDENQERPTIHFKYCLYVTFFLSFESRTESF